MTGIFQNLTNRTLHDRVALLERRIIDGVAREDEIDRYFGCQIELAARGDFSSSTSSVPPALPFEVLDPRD